MTFDFTNKNVLITGGSRGIGKAAAKLFAASGANVIVTYLSNYLAAEETLAEFGQGKHSIYQLNVADPVSIKKIFDELTGRYRKLDVLVNNAAVYTEHKILGTTWENWQECWTATIKANLDGPANMCWHAAQLMAVHKSGKIINISSRGAFRGEPDHPAYAASKAGLNAMSQSLAIALAPVGVSVHVIAPGYVETEMAVNALSGPRGRNHKKSKPIRQGCAARRSGPLNCCIRQ